MFMDQNKTQESTAAGKKLPSNKRSVLAGILIVAVAIAIKIGIKLGLGFFAAEYQVSHSREEAWPQAFKVEFVNSCSSATDHKMIEGIENPDGFQKQKIHEFSQNYCSCIAERVESAHVIRTKYNAMKETAEAYSNETDVAMNAYMDSQAGQQTTEDCKNKATASLETKAGDTRGQRTEN